MTCRSGVAVAVRVHVVRCVARPDAGVEGQAISILNRIVCPIAGSSRGGGSCLYKLPNPTTRVNLLVTHEALEDENLETERICYVAIACYITQVALLGSPFDKAQ